MDVKIASTPTFKSNIITRKQRDLQNPVVRPLIDFLKHNCGGNEVTHTIKVGKNYISICTHYVSSKFHGKKISFKRKKLFINWPFKPINNKLIKKTIDWSHKTNTMLKKLKTCSAQNELPQKKTLWQKIIDFFKFKK